MKLFTWTICLVALLFACATFAAEPEPADLVCSQGEDCYKILVLQYGGVALNLTGYNYRAQIRANPTDTTALADFDIDTTALALGQIKLLLPASVTTQLVGKVAYWDLKQTGPSGDVSYPVRGRFKCLWSITR